MATIKSAIQIYDGMSPALRSMNTAMNVVISNFQALQNISGQAVDINSIQLAREELAKAESTFNQIEEEIKSADLAQQQFNQDIRGAQIAAGGLQKTIMKIAGAIGTMLGFKKLAGLSDEMVQIRARLDLINDGFQTTEELQNMIFASAQRARGLYTTTANAVATLGSQARDAFATNEELIAFTELLNKTFVIAGTSATGVESTMYNLTQALASGVLRGQDLNAVMANAQPIVQNIANYLGVPVGQIRELAAQGEITADIVKNAMFAAADDINTKFETMPRTIGQIWTSIKNHAVKQLDPVLVKINEIVNSQAFQTFANNVVGAIAVVSNVLLWVFELVMRISNFVIENWQLIAPIVWGIVGAMVAYGVVTKGVAIATGALTAAKMIALPIYSLLTGATMAETAAQWGLNAAMYACPLAWIVAGIVALIAVIYGAVAIINHFAETSISATGAIFGAFSVLGAFLWNLFLGFLELVLGVINALVNPFIKIANFIGNVFINPISSIIYLFQGMADSVLAIIEKIASAMDFVFGSNMAATVRGWRDDVRQIAENMVKRYAPEENYQQLVPELDLSVESLGLKRWAYSNAWKVGYEAGEQLELRLGNVFENIFGSVFDDINIGLDEIAFNTASMAKSLDTSEEELKYLRDLAEQEVINRFTTAEIKIDMGGIVNQITKETDIDMVIAYLEEKLYESMSIAAEGVHL